MKHTIMRLSALLLSMALCLSLLSAGALAAKMSQTIDCSANVPSSTAVEKDDISAEQLVDADSLTDETGKKSITGTVNGVSVSCKGKGRSEKDKAIKAYQTLLSKKA